MEELEDWHTVPELAERWNVTSKVVIRRAHVLKVPVKCFLRDVLVAKTTSSYQREKPGLPSMEDFIEDMRHTKTDVQKFGQWSVPLNSHHLEQMVFDGFADISESRAETGEIIQIKSQNQPAKPTPEDCFILDKYALQIEEKYNLGEKGKKSKSSKADTPQSDIKGLFLPTGHEYESSLVEILNLLTPEIYPDGLKGQEKAAITKSIKSVKEQLPEAFKLCCSLIMEAMPCADREEHLKYTRDDVVQQAKERGINRPMALQIHKGLPAVMKK